MASLLDLWLEHEQEGRRQVLLRIVSTESPEPARAVTHSGRLRMVWKVDSTRSSTRSRCLAYLLALLPDSGLAVQESDDRIQMAAYSSVHHLWK